jgi:hypothetical protein
MNTNNTLKLTQEQKERNKQEARSKLIDIILEKMMEEKLDARRD